jgi:alginate O-acetyltransferase complex protein AlgI
MIFNSLEFLIFFAITTTIYFIIPRRYQKYLLIASGIFFYSYFIPWHVLILITTIIFNFYSGKLIENANGKKRKNLLVGIILINIAFLFIFKYFNFVSSNITSLSKSIGWNYSIGTLNLILPLGISFYTFKNICYDIEVYRNTIPAEKKFDIFALYILIFPELLAGPIDRPQNLLPQLRESYGFDYVRVTNGLKLMAWGFFQKWVIADRLAFLVNQVYSQPDKFNGMSFTIATFFFAIQIYCDFSAYTDIAIGAGEVLGFKFMQNFNRPYFARSISEFWSRWHISLSTWLRDYIFLPIAYSVLRKLKNKPFLKIKPEYWSYCLATLLTMFIAGLWHGANWTFVCWGTLMGVYLVFSFVTKKPRKLFVKKIRLNRIPFLHKLLSGGITFSLVCFAWIFFRAGDMKEAVYIIRNLYTGYGVYLRTFISGHNFSNLMEPFYLGLNSMELYLAVIFTSVLIVVNLIQRRNNIRKLISERPLLIRWALYLLVIFIILIYGRFETRQFIYMQF